MDIKPVQEEFFKSLNEIQDRVVNIALCNYKKDDDFKNILYDITFETICDVMTLIDGYGNDNVQLDLIDRKSGESLRTGIELHDKCVDYLKS